jgi:hypothetical protein
MRLAVTSLSDDVDQGIKPTICMSLRFCQFDLRIGELSEAPFIRNLGIDQYVDFYILLLNRLSYKFSRTQTRPRQ